MYSYNYCSNCGELFDKKSEILYVCSKCNFRIFVSPKAAVGVIIFNEKDQILLLKRSNNPYKDMWGLVGGFVDPNEDALGALSREVKEETGLDISKYEFFKSFAGNYLYKGIDYKIINFIFTAKVSNNTKIELSDESTEFSFFNIKDIPLNNFGPKDQLKAITELVHAKHH